MKMHQDKQLGHIKLEDVIEKRRLDQALNAKEFAVLVGISYSSSRRYFNLPGLPAIGGLVFYSDFVQWQNAQRRLDTQNRVPPKSRDDFDANNTMRPAPNFPIRAARILCDAFASPNQST